MVLAESGVLPGQDTSTQMNSNVPEGAIIPAETIPAETQVTQDDLNKAAEARGELIELFG